MRKNRLSLLTSVAVSLSIMLGILVADLANVPTLTAASAQRGAKASRCARVPVAAGTVVADRIVATDVLVNGVATSGVFRGGVGIADSIVCDGDGGTNLTGIFPHVSDGTSDNGIFPHVAEDLSADGIFPHVSDPAPGASLTGGVVEGENVQVVDGVITGQNLRVVGAVVSLGRATTVVVGPGTSPAS